MASFSSNPTNESSPPTIYRLHPFQSLSNLFDPLRVASFRVHQLMRSFAKRFPWNRKENETFRSSKARPSFPGSPSDATLRITFYGYCTLPDPPDDTPAARYAGIRGGPTRIHRWDKLAHPSRSKYPFLPSRYMTFTSSLLARGSLSSRPSLSF